MKWCEVATLISLILCNCHFAIHCVTKPFLTLDSYCIGGIVIGSHGKGISIEIMAVSEHIFK